MSLFPYKQMRYVGFLFLLAATGLSQSADAALIRIMPLGDSITYGSGATGGYRDPLYTKLMNAGYQFQFVGSQTSNATTLLTSAGQTQHEGHSGYVIQTKDPTDTGSGSGRGGIYDNLNTWLGPTINPDVILLMIGTNDININYFPATQGSRLSTLISGITTLKPNASLIVAQIVPVVDTTTDGRAQTYNSVVASVVAQHQALGEHVTMVDMHSALIGTTTANGGDMNDNLHPNASGYNKMANVWLSGIQAVPEPSGLILVGLMGAGMLIRRRRRAD